MYPRPIQQLIEAFAKLPGIGPRQAARFAFFTVKDQRGVLSSLRAALDSIEEKIAMCGQCYRTIDAASSKGGLCAFCTDSKRQSSVIAVVEKESDMQNLEKAGAHRGVYHVLGGVILPLDPESPKMLHLKELHGRVKNVLEEKGVCEVILATSATTEGDTTALYIERILMPLKGAFPQFGVTRLGRGLSLGSELEYADEVTLKSAVENRK